MTVRARIDRLERLAGPARRRLFCVFFEVPNEEHPLVMEVGSPGGPSRIYPHPDPSALLEQGWVLMGTYRTLDPRDI
jgi:hypothetical protein